MKLQHTNRRGHVEVMVWQNTGTVVVKLLLPATDAFKEDLWEDVVA